MLNRALAFLACTCIEQCLQLSCFRSFGLLSQEQSSIERSPCLKRRNKLLHAISRWTAFAKSFRALRLLQLPVLGMNEGNQQFPKMTNIGLESGISTQPKAWDAKTESLMYQGSWFTIRLSCFHDVWNMSQPTSTYYWSHPWKAQGV